MSEPSIAGRIYEPAAYAAKSLEGCFWVQTAPDPAQYPRFEGESSVEFAVIGAGFTGLSAALRLSEAGAEVAVLDAHPPGWGASGRNGGFCCIGGAKASSAQIRTRYGAAEAAKFHAAERAAIEQVSDRIATLGLSVDRHSEGELQLAHSPKVFAQMRAEAAQISATYGVQADLIGPGDLASMGLNAQGMHGGLRLDLGFALNPRKYALGLARAVQDRGGRIHADSAVHSITREGEFHVLHTAHGRLRARHLLMATNGYSSDTLPRWMRSRYLPLQSSVIVTRPLSENEIAAQGWSSDLMAYDSRNLLHYFRLMPDRRMLFGMRGAVRWSDASQRAHRTATRAHFDAMFPAWQGVETSHFWSGLVCLARDLVPFVGALGQGERVYGAFAYHGNGVAMGSWSGDQMARLALGQPTDLPNFFQRSPQRFELGPLRRLSLPLALLHYRIKDALS
ncbi:FAD-binding oxidoreductase [uncultured Thioclava sp.]|uniref:NAD(P)/FAD-dependent oxidoreductase n=1 Tax=uncultured Thioclava sp. TaxID=473858 RepID=UPI0025F6B3F2|nr:FAD-binding oxidoreductase [uncultured Thioclava sp.]